MIIIPHIYTVASLLFLCLAGSKAKKSGIVKYKKIYSISACGVFYSLPLTLAPFLSPSQFIVQWFNSIMKCDGDTHNCVYMLFNISGVFVVSSDFINLLPRSRMGNKNAVLSSFSTHSRKYRKNSFFFWSHVLAINCRCTTIRSLCRGFFSMSKNVWNLMGLGGRTWAADQRRIKFICKESEKGK